MMAEEVNQQNVQNQDEPSYEQIREEMHRQSFDEPSELLKGGYTEDVVTDGPEEPAPDTGEEPAEPPQQLGEPAPQPQKRRINFNGADYDLGDAELEQLAKRGLEFSTMQSRLLPYANIIAAVEADPRLGEAIANTIRAYRNGVPMGQPQPDTKAQDPNKEPEIGENEDYDAYEKRLAEWREARNQRLIDEKVSAHIRALQERGRRAQIAEANQRIINYVQADPEREKVMSVIGGNSFPPGLRQQMEFDGPLFMSVYDTIRSDLGLQPYFGAPALWGKAHKQQAGKPREQAKAAPFAESGKTNSSGSRGGVSSDGLPDFKHMSDDEFRAFKTKVLFSNF